MNQVICFRYVSVQILLLSGFNLLASYLVCLGNSNSHDVDCAYNLWQTLMVHGCFSFYRSLPAPEHENVEA
jgi:hypothetical protein